MSKSSLSIIVIALLGLSNAASCSSQTQTTPHVSPPSWWVGMADNTVQLMVHHQDIAEYAPSIDAEGVKIVSYTSPGSDNYLIIDVMISADTSAKTVEIAFTHSDKPPLSVDYNLAARAEGSAQRQGFSAKDVIYLIAPDRFANGDKGNDNVSGYADKHDPAFKGGRHGGDIAGMQAHLGYLADMGFTQIWTMPLLENAMDRYSYHGYSTTDYYRIDPRFGSNQEYKTFVAEASTHGIGVIKDVVLNHIGSEHPWMHDHPSTDWVNNNFEFTPTSHRREALHDPHGVAQDAAAHSDGWFVPTMPDLNQRNPYVAKYLIQHAIWWIEYAGLSGLRVDTYSYSDKDFLSAWTRRLMAEYPNLTIVGEEWSTNPLITSYWQKGSVRYDDYETHLPSVMDFPFQVALTQSLNNKERWDTGLRQLYESLASDFVYGDPYNLVIFADNHDMSRVMTQLNDDYALWDMAMTVLLTTRGIPQIFYGTELAMHHPGTDDHGIIRTNFPGGFEDQSVNGFTGEGLNPLQVKAQQRLKLLLNKRKASKAITEGTLTQYSPADGIYVYFRRAPDGSEAEMVAVNKNDEKVELPLARFHQALQGAVKMNRWRDNMSMDIPETLTLDGKNAAVWTLELQ